MFLEVPQFCVEVLHEDQRGWRGRFTSACVDEEPLAVAGHVVHVERVHEDIVGVKESIDVKQRRHLAGLRRLSQSDRREDEIRTWPVEIEQLLTVRTPTRCEPAAR